MWFTYVDMKTKSISSGLIILILSHSKLKKTAHVLYPFSVRTSWDIISQSLWHWLDEFGPDQNTVCSTAVSRPCSTAPSVCSNVLIGAEQTLQQCKQWEIDCPIWLACQQSAPGQRGEEEMRRGEERRSSGAEDLSKSKHLSTHLARSSK